MKLSNLLIAVAAAFVCSALSSQAIAFTPRTGHWYNPNESGSGYNIDIQNGTLVVTIFSFKTTGDSEWYISSGPMTAGQKSYTGPLIKVRNGQCISCAYHAATSGGTDGNITISFTTETAATLSLPGRTTTIQPFNFGFGTMPTAMVGTEWTFTEVIGTTYFADHYKFNILGTATSGGSGTVGSITSTTIISCEEQTSGTYRGQVLCAHADGSGALVEGYLFSMGLDQTFNGSYLALSSNNMYPMKGYMTTSGGSANFTKDLDVTPIDVTAKQIAGAGVKDVEKASDELLMLFYQLVR